VPVIRSKCSLPVAAPVFVAGDSATKAGLEALDVWHLGVTMPLTRASERPAFRRDGVRFLMKEGPHPRRAGEGPGMRWNGSGSSFKLVDIVSGEAHL
jgi:hypothetical protein